MQRFSQRCFSKVVSFILRDRKEKNIQPRQNSMHNVFESLRMDSLTSRENFPDQTFS